MCAGQISGDDDRIGRPHYRYQVRHFKVEDGGHHQCTGNVVAVLSSSYSHERKAWYITVLVKKMEITPELTIGEEFFYLRKPKPVKGYGER